jgi:hypothetical protein
MEPLSNDQARGLLRAEPDLTVTVPEFTRVRSYTTFEAEWAVIETDLVLHFYLPPELVEQAGADQGTYWREVFPAALDPTAQDFFKNRYPRIKAAYVEEMKSWWLRAYGFAGLDPEGLVLKFLDTLDLAIDAMKSK